ncbi:MAG: hypothetical protein GX267_08975 [Fibrobacter sp.]|jgi:hypothetical protein|nr:hypothetical protein [Fibrobacter sp.]
MNRNMNSVSALFTLILLAGFVFYGCKGGSGIRLGQEIPSDIKTTKLSEILAQPSSYNGKKVVISGIISGQCPSLCEFFFKDGANQVTIFPQGFKFPKLESGKKVTVYASITSGEENVVFSALGIRTE